MLHRTAEQPGSDLAEAWMFTGCMHLGSGTEHAKTQSENTCRPGPVKLFGRHKETPGPSKERRHRLSCCRANSTWMHHSLPQCNHNRRVGSLDETCNILHVADRGIDLPSTLETKHWQSQRMIPSEKPTGTYGWHLNEHERPPIVWNIKGGQVCCLAAEPLNLDAS